MHPGSCLAAMACCGYPTSAAVQLLLCNVLQLPPVLPAASVVACNTSQLALHGVHAMLDVAQPVCCQVAVTPSISPPTAPCFHLLKTTLDQTFSISLKLKISDK